MYTGKLEEYEGWLGAHVINKLLAALSECTDIRKHHIYFDNFFASVDTLSRLSERNIHATGTVRENRLSGAKQALVSSKEMKKRERGTYDKVCNGIVFVCKWHDNSIVNIASNTLMDEPVHTVRQKVKGGEKHVPQPHIVQCYNKGVCVVSCMTVNNIESIYFIISLRNGRRGSL